MNPSKPTPHASLWLSLSIFSAFAAFAAATSSPLALLLVVGYMASFLIPSRMPRDSANIWGLRLLVYAGGAVLGRSLAPGPIYYYDARAFITPAVILGGEIILQSFREPPRSLRYDPVIILLTGLIFLISSNTLRPFLFFFAPIYVFCTLMALSDARADAPAATLRVNLQRLSFLGFACVLGAVLHLQLWNYRSNIMALGARLLSTAQATAQGDNVGENPQLGTSFGANLSTTRLMRITGKLSSHHLRTAAFDIYENGTWGPSISSRTTSIKPALAKDTLEEDPKDPLKNRTDTDATITVLRETGGVLFAPLNIYALVPPTGNSFDWKRYDGPLKTDDPPPNVYSVINSKKDVGGFEITQGPLTLPPDYRDANEPASTPRTNGSEGRRLLEVPEEIDPRVRQLARNITKGAPTDLVKVSRIINYLFENHKYSYEFVRGSQDPVSDFLLNKKAGHCQYFASAATILMRCAGVPARYVTGYYAHENSTDGSMLVRGRDAHAWTEAYISYTDEKTGAKGNGFRKKAWISIDATVPDGRADPKINPLPVYQTASEWTQDTFTRVRDWFGRLTPLQIAEIMGLVLVVWGLERWRQTRKKSRQKPNRMPLPAELAPLAQRFERVLTRRGIPLVEERPWSEILPTEFEAETRWVELYNRIRFAEDGAAKLDELRSDLETLEKDKSRVKSAASSGASHN